MTDKQTNKKAINNEIAEREIKETGGRFNGFGLKVEKPEKFHIEHTKQTFSLPAKKWHELEYHLNKIRDLINENAEVFDNTKLKPNEALPVLKYGQSVFVKKPK